jgi:hypothetical protein
MKLIVMVLLVAMLSGCVSWQDVADTGIMGAGWKNTEVAK